MIPDDTAALSRALCLRCEVAVLFARWEGYDEDGRDPGTVEVLAYEALRQARAADNARWQAHKTRGLPPGRKRGKRPRNPERDAESLRLRGEGLTYKAIGLRFGVSPQAAEGAVKREAKRLGVEVPAGARERAGAP